MDKAGWQISTFIAGLALVGTTFGLVANKNALTQERNDKQACPEAQIEPSYVTEDKTMNEARRLALEISVSKDFMSRPDNVRCEGGRLIIQTEHGFESLTRNGQAMSCDGP